MKQALRRPAISRLRALPIRKAFLRVNIGNADTLTVGVAANATAATVASAVKAAIDAETSLPVTATASEGLVTLTAKNKGTHGNHIRIRTGNTAEGITVAVKAMSGGDADADIGPALNAVIAEGHNLIAVGCTDEANLLKLRTHLELSVRLKKNAGHWVFMAKPVHWRKQRHRQAV